MLGREKLDDVIFCNMMLMEGVFVDEVDKVYREFTSRINPALLDNYSSIRAVS